MMVRVDQPRQHNMRVRVEGLDLARDGFAAGGDQFGDAPVLHHDAAPCAIGENRERVFDPERGGCIGGHWRPV